MGLRRALESLPGDRETQSFVRELLLAFERHRDERLGVAALAEASRVPIDRALPVLEVLVSAFVVDFDAAGYRYAPDRLLEREVGAFVRRVESNSGALRENVARFRERYTR